MAASALTQSETPGLLLGVATLTRLDLVHPSDPSAQAGRRRWFGCVGERGQLSSPGIIACKCL